MKNKKQFGLIGKNIEYSFSRRFFLEKFNSNDKYLNFSYINYDIKSIDEKAKVSSTTMFLELGKEIKREELLKLIIQNIDRSIQKQGYL